MRIIILLILCIGFYCTSFSQNLRQVKGLSFLDCQGGIISSGYVMDVNYNLLFKHKVFYQLGGTYFTGKSESTNFQVVALNNTANINLFSLKKLVYFNVGAGLDLSYEFLSATKEDRLKEGFSFGPVFNLESEIVLYGDLSLVLKTEYIKRFRSSILDNYASLLIGLRYYL
jgi:hypothetical protein